MFSEGRSSLTAHYRMGRIGARSVDSPRVDTAFHPPFRRVDRKSENGVGGGAISVLPLHPCSGLQPTATHRGPTAALDCLVHELFGFMLQDLCDGAAC